MMIHNQKQTSVQSLRRTSRPIRRAKASYKHIAGLLNQLSANQRARQVCIDTDWPIARILSLFGSLDPSQGWFIETLAGTTMGAAEAIAEHHLGSLGRFERFLSGVDERLIAGGVHPSEVYQARYSLAGPRLQSFTIELELTRSLDRQLTRLPIQISTASVPEKIAATLWQHYLEAGLLPDVGWSDTRTVFCNFVERITPLLEASEIDKSGQNPSKLLDLFTEIAPLFVAEMQQMQPITMLSAEHLHQFVRRLANPAALGALFATKRNDN